LFPGKDLKSTRLFFLLICTSTHFLTSNPEINQFTIIIELLATPRNDVIQTIASE
jgi:hypothetical protein